MSRKWTLKELVEEYAAWLSNPDTGKAIRYHMKPILVLFGGWQVKNIGPAQVQEFLADQKKKGLSKVTACQRAKILRTAFSWAVRMGKLPTSPLAMLRIPTPKSRRIEPPTKEEVASMYQHASPHVQRVLVLGLACGPRIGPSELFSLQWKDVDLDAGIIHMPNADKGVREESRSIPIRDDILPLMKEWKNKDGKCPFVINYRGKKVFHIDHAWHKAREAAGISRRITPYSLRHAFPTEALDHGADIKAVAEIMGHADPTMILKTYQHVKFKRLVETVNTIPSFLNKKEG